MKFYAKPQVIYEKLLWIEGHLQVISLNNQLKMLLLRGPSIPI